MKTVRVVLADDHEIVLEGLRRVLAPPDFEIVACASDGLELIAAVERLRPDAIVTDITMPGLNGIEAARRIRKTHPRAKLVFLTMHPDHAYAVKALVLGDCGYVLKSSAADELVAAIRAVMRGETYVSSKIAESVYEGLRGQAHNGAALELTEREIEILQSLAEGGTFKQVAAALHISPRTVEFHRNRITEKTGLRTKAELARYAVRIGLVPN
jgi:DNA-binding NarL/FixJ family response regulator